MKNTKIKLTLTLNLHVPWPKSVMANSICSWQIQFAHGKFNLLTAISICSRQFQFAHGNFNLLTAISICSRQYQYFNLLAASHGHSLNRGVWGWGCISKMTAKTRECYSNLCFTKGMNTKKLFKYWEHSMVSSWVSVY